MAATRPSIMSLGEIRSAPAPACETATRPSSGSVASLATVAVREQHAAVAVVGVLAQAHIRRDHEARGRRRGWRVSLTCTGPSGSQARRALGVLVAGQPEQDHAADAGGRCALRLGRGQVGREVGDAGEGGDGFAAALAGHDEHREDQVPRLEAGLAHQVAQPLRPPESAGPDGVGHIGILTGAR